VAILNETGAPAITNVRVVAYALYANPNIGIKNHKDLVLNNVTVEAHSVNLFARNVGIWNEGSASLTMNNGTVMVSSNHPGELYAMEGILNVDSDVSNVLINNSIIQVTGDGAGYGIYGNYATLTVEFSKVIVNLSGNSFGIWSRAAGPSVLNSEVRALSGSAYYGRGILVNYYPGTLDIERSLIEGSYRAIDSSRTANITKSEIIGDTNNLWQMDIDVSIVDGSLGGSGTYSCVGVYEPDLDPITCP